MPASRNSIRDLAVIGDQRTAALVTRHGSIVWYCPERFDRPSLLGALLDSAAGEWWIDLPGTVSTKRGYIAQSAILETELAGTAGKVTITDWMPVGEDVPRGAVCRMLSASSTELSVIFAPAPDYARRAPSFVVLNDGVQIDDEQLLFASHALVVEDGQVRFSVPAGERSWTALLPRGALRPNTSAVAQWHTSTLARWAELAAGDSHDGPYASAVQASLRALRLLTHEQSGGILAAITTSLPEVSGGTRNYDYRYVWLRDAGMIASALMRSGGGEQQAVKFLDFICASRTRSVDIFLPPALSLEGSIVPEEEAVETLAGHDGGHPVVVGNGARTQLQLDALGNVLLVAKLIYNRIAERPHLSMISELADFLVLHWQEPDYGLWEEQQRAQYTSSKVIVACALDFIAAHASGAAAERWHAASRSIRAYVAANCLTSSGAYAAIAGGEAVDVSAALFPVWAFCDADTPEMLATLREIERDLAEGDLYRRRLELFPSAKEGVFLAGTFWIAQYWIMRGKLDKASRIIDAALGYANDLGFFAEEGAPRTGEMVGNFPQSFVHAAFVGTVFDLTSACDAIKQNNHGDSP